MQHSVARAQVREEGQLGALTSKPGAWLGSCAGGWRSAAAARLSHCAASETVPMPANASTMGSGPCASPCNNPKPYLGFHMIVMASEHSHHGQRPLRQPMQ